MPNGRRELPGNGKRETNKREPGTGNRRLRLQRAASRFPLFPIPDSRFPTGFRPCLQTV